MNTWTTTAHERLSLADDLASLTENEWDMPSLCDRWHVRHVVAHLISGATMHATTALGGLLRSGFNFNRFTADDALIKGEALAPSELLAALRDTASSRTTAPMTKPDDARLEVVIHGQDIRRSLDLPQHFDTDTLIIVAERLKTYGFPFGTKKRIAGLHLQATGTSWSTGNGAPVTGSLETLVMVMAGRARPLAELSGGGVATLHDRLTPTRVISSSHAEDNGRSTPTTSSPARLPATSLAPTPSPRPPHLLFPPRPRSIVDALRDSRSDPPPCHGASRAYRGPRLWAHRRGRSGGLAGFPER
jgi:uncharacterized protein (TIGR03083 family)